MTMDSDDVRCVEWAVMTMELMTSFGPKEYSLHVVGLLLLNAAQIVLTPPAPRNGGPFLDRSGLPLIIREEWVDNNNNVICAGTLIALRQPQVSDNVQQI